jgi:protein tyrosine kinase modulator
MIPGKVYTPDELLSIAWQRKWLLVLPLLATTLGAAGYARYLPDQYRSETVILVVPQRVPESYVRSTVTMRIEDRLQSITQQVLSRARLERIIADFDLYPAMRRSGTMDAVVEQTRRDIDIPPPRGDSFRIAYTSDDPSRAMVVTERLASLFIEESLRDREVLAQGTNQFLETQLQDARGRLIAVEKRLEEYRRQHGNELPTQVDSNLQAMNGEQMQLQALADSISRDRDRRWILDRTAAELAQPKAGGGDTRPAATASGAEQPQGSGQTHAQQLEDARKQLQELEPRLKPTHPDVKRLRRLIADLQQKVDADAAAELARPSTDASSAGQAAAANREATARQRREVQEEIENLDRQIGEKEQQQAQLKEVIAEYQRRIDAAPKRESELTELTRDYTTIQTLYSSLLSKNEDAKISANLERRQIGEQFRVLEPPRLPLNPSSPNRPRIVGFGALIGLALGVGLTVLIEYRDTTLKTDDDVVAALALPVLALVPVMQSAADLRRRRRRILVSIASAATAALSVAGLLAIWKMKSGF